MDGYTPEPLFVCQQISALAESQPQSVALQHGSQALTYGELDQRAGQFAAFLKQNGLEGGSTVALCLERSIDWIVAALGTMRAGSAYVPLDAGWAIDRLRFSIDNSEAAFVVARADQLEQLALKVKGIDPARDAAQIGGARSLPVEATSGESLAYLIYTSGSTGVPKGVELTHANLAHLIAWHQNAFAIKPGERTSHLAGLGFDAAVWEIWPSLASGATVVLVDEGARSSADLLKQWLIEEKVQVSFVPTTLAKTMITSEWPAETKLRLMLTGGDALPRGPIEGLPFEVVNNYGPTESTVVATSGVVPPGSDYTPSIGKAILGSSVYLLDEEGRRVSPGTPGEIYIGGTGVARGYRGLEEQTAAAFLPDPFSAGVGGRMYRSGDIAIELPGGELDFRGRTDRQVKINGQRVELDEISSVLGRHPRVEFATATVRVSEAGEKQLVGYVLPRAADASLTAQALQEYLLASLPKYMVPGAFVKLQTLPVSRNGKIDYSMLEHPSETNLLVGASGGRAPSTIIEERLLEMVRELLETDAVALEDDFFLVGGHSLIGMQLVLRLRETFGVDVTLRQLFQASTVERLASVIEASIIASVEDLSDEEAGLQLAE